MSLVLTILKLLFKLAPAVLEAVRRWDAEQNAKIIVAMAEEAVKIEVAQRGFDAAMARFVALQAKDLLVKKQIEELEGFR